MCKAFSCVVTKKGKVLWQAGMDSHDELIDKYKLKDDTTDGDVIGFCKIEVTPDDGYLHPEGKWTLKVDENTTPRWWNKTKEKAALEACEEWKTAVYSGINLKEAQNPIHPLNIKAKEVTEQDIELLKLWASVRDSVRASVGASVWDSVWDSVGDSVGDSVRASVWDSVRASVWDSVRDSVWDSVGDSVGDSVRDSVGDSVRDSVWDSVRAYIGSLFPNITEWQYAPKTDGYPYQPCVDLWKRGFVASFDGKVWRLHAGKKAKIVFEISKEELMTDG
jgi:hypothetical protein